MRIDSLPERSFPGKIMQLSPLTEMGWEWPPTRTFRGFAMLQNEDGRLRTGMNGRMDVILQAHSQCLERAFEIDLYQQRSADRLRRLRRHVYAGQCGCGGAQPGGDCDPGRQEGTLVSLVEPEKTP